LTLERDLLTPGQDRLTLGQDRLTLGQDLLTLGRDLLTLEQDLLTRAESAICGGGSLKNPVKYEIFYGGLIKIRIQDQQVKDGVWEYSKNLHKNH
jgi:hypothetical protein